MQTDRGIFRIKGGNPISGTIRPQGNKNEALPLLAAALLTGEPVTLSNLPDIEDVSAMKEILRQLGVSVEELADGATRIQATEKPEQNLPAELSSSLRGSRYSGRPYPGPAPVAFFYPDPAATELVDVDWILISWPCRLWGRKLIFFRTALNSKRKN